MLQKFKNAIVLLSPLLLAQCASESYHYPSDLEQGHISGPVTQLFTSFYEIDTPSGKEILTTTTVELFHEHSSSPSDTIRNIITGEEIVNVLSFNTNTSMNKKTTFINGRKEMIMEGVYNNRGKFVRINILNGNDSLQEYYLIDKLSAKGNIDAARHYQADGQLVERFYNIHNDFTRVSAMNVDTSGMVTYRDTVQVNEKKWPVRSIEFYIDNKNLVHDTLHYQYDSIDHYGNWQIKITKSTRKPITREVRQFIYAVGK